MAPTRKQKRRLRHTPDQATQFLHIARMSRMQHRSCAQKEKALENGVIQGVKEARDQRDGGKSGMAQCNEHQRSAEPDQDDADILDAVISKQAFEIVLHQRVKHAEESGDDSKREDHRSGPQRRNPQKLEQHPRQAVDSGLNDNPGHQRRDMAGRCWMSFRKPDVKRNDSSLHSKTCKEKQNNGHLHGTGQIRGRRGEAENSKLPDNEFRSRNPISKHPVPACDMTKNSTPA